MSTESQLAIAGKRPRPRPGGCAGIFFQMMEWNRRPAKKKLSPRNILSSVRALKWASQKFAGGNEKMPKKKLLPVGEWNAAECSLPAAAAAEAPQLASSKDTCAPGLVARLMGLESLPIVKAKPRMSPHEEGISQQGLLVERKPFGPGQFSSTMFSKRLLSRSKREMPKHLPSPKSPRMHPRKGSRLMGVATRILEPGLQSKSQSKLAIGYIKDPLDRLALKESSERSKESVVGCCKSCGSFVELDGLVFSTYENFQGPDGKEDNDISLHEGDDEKEVPLAVNVESQQSTSNVRKYQLQNGQGKCKPRKQTTSNLRPIKRPAIGDKELRVSKNSSQQQMCKDMNKLSLRRSLTTSTESRNFGEHTMFRKPQPFARPQIENRLRINSNSSKERTARNPSGYQNRVEYDNNHSIRRSPTNIVPKNEAVKRSSKCNRNVVPLSRQNSLSRVTDHVKAENIRVHREPTNEACNNKNFELQVKTGGSTSPEEPYLSRDALSSVLDQKFQELTFLDKDAFAAGNIYHEDYSSVHENLISSLRVRETKLSQIYDESCSNVSSYTINIRDILDCSTLHNEFHTMDRQLNEESESPQCLAVLTSEGGQPSPISVLESCFSNSSSICETLNMNFDHELHPTPTEGSSHQIDIENESLNSAASLNINCDAFEHFNHNIIDRSPFTNLDLLLEEFILNESDEMRTYLEFFLFKELETCLQSLLYVRRNKAPSIDFKDLGQARRLVFDCMIECLDSKLNDLMENLYGSWFKHVFYFSKGNFTTEIREKIQRWSDFVSRGINDMLIVELHDATSRWIHRGTDKYEIVMDVESDILNVLIHEAVMELF